MFSPVGFSITKIYPVDTFKIKFSSPLFCEFRRGRTFLHPLATFKKVNTRNIRNSHLLIMIMTK